MEATKRKREDQDWEYRNGLTPPRSDHFLLGRRITVPFPWRAGGLSPLVFIEHDADAIFGRQGSTNIVAERCSAHPHRSEEPSATSHLVSLRFILLRDCRAGSHLPGFDCQAHQG